MVRCAQLGDAGSIAALLDELGYPSTATQVEARLAALPADELVLVAELDGAIGGLAGLRVERLIERDDPAARLAALVVGERFRRRGAGAALVAAAEDQAGARGCELIVLNSASRRADAHTFYERLGYKTTGRRFAKDI